MAILELIHAFQVRSVDRIYSPTNRVGASVSPGNMVEDPE